MSVSVYKLLHFLGIFMVMTALGGVLVSTSLSPAQQQRWKRLAGLTHGIGLLIILVAGFGLLAKLQLGFELWVILKLVLWLMLGAFTVAVRRFPQFTTPLWWSVPAIALLAAYLGHYKPA